jgi:hypothetical protein
MTRTQLWPRFTWRSGEQLAIVVEIAGRIRTQCPDVWLSFLESAAFVNWRCTERSEAPLLVVCAG